MSADQVAEQPISKKTLCKFDDSIMTIDELVSFLRLWATDKITSGTAFTLEVGGSLSLPHIIDYQRSQRSYRKSLTAWSFTLKQLRPRGSR